MTQRKSGMYATMIDAQCIELCSEIALIDAHIDRLKRIGGNSIILHSFRRLKQNNSMFAMSFVFLVCVLGLASALRLPSARFLSMKSVDATTITPGIIIGAGRIGSHFYESNGQRDVLFTSRDEMVSADSTGPIYVCTRNGDLDRIIDSTPSNRREDLIFLQNGVLTEYLKSKGLEDNTQALIYYAVSKKGEKPIDGITELNPNGLTAVTGKWAEDLAARLKQAGLTCNVYDKPTWTVAMVTS